MPGIARFCSCIFIQHRMLLPSLSCSISSDTKASIKAPPGQLRRHWLSNDCPSLIQEKSWVWCSIESETWESLAIDHLTKIGHEVLASTKSLHCPLYSQPPHPPSPLWPIEVQQEAFRVGVVSWKPGVMLSDLCRSVVRWVGSVEVGPVVLSPRDRWALFSPQNAMMKGSS